MDACDSSVLFFTIGCEFTIISKESFNLNINQNGKMWKIPSIDKNMEQWLSHSAEDMVIGATPF